ncbi:fimbrial biogenesis outer membrane usher protein [Brucella endophytica]|uniref:Fimbrial biogenesis outer membrane usher protein n=1 Tax=Brucella endophytica TaxID=1963359 RepID=A0A916S886_9HYPH|nr:fimbria/pilus outer membrane usher protein [Brucella endophytica]GGA86548.1 fimbrial biogenesis outer membrane usher protein [Brucella endophytica]
MLTAAISTAGATIALAQGIDLSVLDTPLRPSLEQAQPNADLQLEITINGDPVKLVASVRKEADGALSMEPDELRNIGIRPVDIAKRPDGRIALDRLPNVKTVLDEQRQILDFIAPNSARQPRQISAGGGIQPLGRDDPRNKVETNFGTLLNYSLYANVFSGDNEYFWRDGLSGTFENRIFGSAGVIDNSMLLAEGDVRRLDSRWAWSDIDTLRTYRAGDVITGALSWTRPTRLGGIQLQRNFSLRPGLVTMPVPDFSASAAVPSTVDVFLNNARRFSNPVPAGPFELTDMPVVTGAGTARIVVRDASGNETVTESAYFVSDQLLRRGFLDYSLELGVPRTGYGTEEDTYEKQLMGSASTRYGLTNWLTLEGHAEGGEGLANAGLGVVSGIGRWGVGSLAVSGSTADGETGYQITGAAEFDLFGARLQARIQRAFGIYNDIASVTTPRLVDDDGYIYSGAAAKAMDQVSLSFPLNFDVPSYVNLNYTRLERFDGYDQSVVGASFSRALFGGTFTASGFTDLEDDEYGVIASFSMPIGKDMTLSTSALSNKDGVSGIATLSRPAREENGNLGWWVSRQQNDNSSTAASVDWRAPVARLGGTVSNQNGETAANAQVSGSVVAMGGGVFVADRIDDAFAVVDAGIPGVPVLFENRPAGKTGRNGKLLLPDLRSYERNRIGVDPKDLPLDVNVDATRRDVIPAGRSGVIVPFGKKEAGDSSLVIFRQENGDFLEMGTQGRTGATLEPFMVGHDGETFIEGLQSHNRLIMERPNGEKCVAEFNYRPKPGEQTVVPDVPCVSLKE